MRRFVVLAALVGMLVTFAAYAAYVTNQLNEKTACIQALDETVGILVDTVAQQAETLEVEEANKQRMASAWHVREMELIDSMQVLGNCGLKGIQDLEAVRRELEMVLEGVPEVAPIFGPLSDLITKAHDNLFVVFMADEKPVPYLPPEDDDPLMLGRPAKIAQVYESGTYVYMRVMHAPGTKSEGVDGWLINDGSPVEPEDSSVDTPWGVMYWHGMKRVHPWNPVGWHKFPKEGPSMIEDQERIGTN